LQRRLAWRNERNLFKRKCDLCSKQIFTFYTSDSKFPVYCSDCWWSDKWDPLTYGRDFDFSRPFFEQFNELMNEVPKMGMLSFKNENSEYNSLLAFSKNSYMSPGSYHVNDCYFIRKSQYCTDCINSIFIDHCELVAESVNCQNCYNCSHLINCRNCSDSKYLSDCFSCKNCFMCSGISHKEFYFKNKEYEERDYWGIVKDQLERDPKELMKDFQEFNKTVPKKYQNQISSENSSGDYIQNSKNALNCYDCFDVQDSKYLTECVNVKDSMDITCHDKEVELCYELCTGGEKSYKHLLSVASIASPNTYYLHSCYYLADSFGCDGFHLRQKNCILNKKYSEDEYKEILDKIIKFTKETGEFGEFFPIQYSPFPYNYSLAQDYFPLDQEQAIQKGYKWADPKQSDYSKKDEDVMECEKCKKSYKYIDQEKSLSEKMLVPLSRLCPNCRILELQSLRNHRKLWKRKCDKCEAKIQSTYAPERPEKVYCEECYLKEVVT